MDEAHGGSAPTVPKESPARQIWERIKAEFSWESFPRAFYLEEEHGQEGDGEGDHDFGVVLCWQLLQGWQRALGENREFLSPKLSFPLPGAPTDRGERVRQNKE